MSSNKVTVSRKWLGPVPVKNGNKVPKELWPKERRFCWIVRWHETNGRKRGKLFEKKREAEKFALKLQESVNASKQDEPQKIKLKYFISEHKKLMKNQVSEATLVDQIRVLRFLVDFLGSERLLVKISSRDAEAFIAHRLQQKLSLATVNKDIRTLKRIFNLAIEPRGYIREDSNPFAKIKQRKLTPKTIRYLSTKEYHALIENNDKLWWKAFISVAYCCGLRKGEILNLTWNDIDFINQLIHVRAKERSKDNLAWESKTHENRSVPMPEQTAQHLANLQAEAQEGFPYVFISPERFEIITLLQKKAKWSNLKAIKNNLNRDFDVVRRRAGVSKCTLHDLRRSAITNWAQALPIQAVQQFAGHSNITTTKKYYLAVRKEDVEKAGTFINKLLTQSK
ncbi:MAG: site-specific integrase [Sedimentisphaerales bacterium]|nr:site-specific integrase [Sedimentisphaerales bacterium]